MDYQQIGNYQIIARLGTDKKFPPALHRFFGISNEVGDSYLGEHILHKTLVTVMVLNNLQFKEVFFEDPRFLALFDHPNILHVYEINIDHDPPYWVTNYVPDPYSHHLHREDTPLDLLMVVSYVKQIAAALQCIHDNGFIHRDVKSLNLFVGQNHEILLGWFEAPTAVEVSSQQDKIAIVGTPEYMAPEAFKGKPCLASDQYALAVTAYKWLCGRFPFDSSTLVQMAFEHMYTPPPSLRAKAPTIPPAVEEVILTALAKEPQRRFANMQAFARALEQASRPRNIKPEQLARIGKHYGKYRLTQFLGEGSFGDVYLGEHLQKNSEAAIKILKARLSISEFKQFVNEARTILLVHPHIVRLLDFGIESDDTPFLVMYYAPNGTLRDLHPKGSILSLSIITSYVKQIAVALQYAHDQNLIHRDLKPENLLLGQDNTVLLSDFGIAITSHGTDSWVQQNIAGTAPYMAPEQFSAKAIPASDQYSLGIILYEWICGSRPFTQGDMGYHHNNTPPPPLHEKISTISPQVEKVVMRALSKDPHQRWPSIQEFANALEQAYKEL